MRLSMFLRIELMYYLRQFNSGNWVNHCILIANWSWLTTARRSISHPSFDCVLQYGTCWYLTRLDASWLRCLNDSEVGSCNWFSWTGDEGPRPTIAVLNVKIDIRTKLEICCPKFSGNEPTVALWDADWVARKRTRKEIGRVQPSAAKLCSQVRGHSDQTYALQWLNMC